MSMKNIASNDTRSALSHVEGVQVQPNAVDVRIDKLFAINHDSVFHINEDMKQHRGSVEVEPDEFGNFNLQPGTSYEFLAEGTVTIGEGEAGFIITRSTLNRNGLFLTSGLYDTGYSGVMAGVIHNNSGKAVIQKGTRVGQMLIWEAEALHAYDGDYGTGKMDDKLYASN